MSRYYQRPESAVKRANEFIEVGKPARALDTLYEVIKNKRHRAQNYSEKVLEPIMQDYLKLCVSLKKSNFAKEGLFQYRNICQSVNIASLEKVVRYYLQLATEKTEEAREKSQQAFVDIDDLDNLSTPESIMLRAVSIEQAQDRADRDILAPWVKFLWESYRQCLDLLRTNARVERLYHEFAKEAFGFCLKYNRKTEFRKICENLRTHLSYITKQQDHLTKQQGQVMSINLSADTQQLNLDTRLSQLDYAMKMELWQEAYKAIEDIHTLMSFSDSKKLAKPQMMASYYQKLSMVFWKAGNYLFHAAALFELFQLSREQRKNITPEEVQKMASKVLVATMSVPLPSAHPEYDRFIETEKNAMEKTQRLAMLLKLPAPPSRAQLLKDLVKYNVVTLAFPETKNLYQHLEVTYGPLDLCDRVQTSLDFLEKQDMLKQYIQPIQKITLTRLVKQLSQVYQVIQFDRLLELAPFTNAFEMERIVVDLVRHNDMQVRIDHQTRCVRFGLDLSEAQRVDLPEGPTIQAMPSEAIRNQLINMMSVLESAITVIQPTGIRVKRQNLKDKVIKNYHQTKVHDHQRMLDRKRKIEDRKEYLENLSYQREEKERHRQEEQLKAQMAKEQSRLEQEAKIREQKQREAELRDINMRRMKEKIEQLEQSPIGTKVLANLKKEDIISMDPSEIMQKQLVELEKEQREQKNRLKTQEKRIDYLERAKRLEEIPLVHKFIDDKKIKDRTYWESFEKERIDSMVKEHHQAQERHSRLKRMSEDRDRFMEQLKSARKSVFKEKLTEFNKMLEAERKRRLENCKELRKQERRNKWIQEREEEKQQKRDEELKRQREEEERKEQERKEEEEEQYRQTLAKLNAVEEKKRAKEREIEERERLEKEKQEERREREDNWRQHDEGEWRKKEDGPSREKVAWKPGGGSWRERQKAKEDEWKPKEPEPGSWRRGTDEPDSGDRKERRDPYDTPERSPKEAFREDDRRRMDRGPAPRSVPPRSSDTSDWRRGGDDRDRELRRDFDRRDPDDRRIPPRDRDLPLRDRNRDFGSSRDRDFGSLRDRRDREFGDRDRDRDFGGPRDRDREFTRDRDFGGPRDRDRDFGGPRDRDRDFGGPRDRDRDFGGPRDRDRDFGGPRDRDRDFGGPRDRDRDFGGSRDRDFGGPRDRDRDFGGPRDRDRDFGGPRDRDRDFGGPRDRDRDFGGPRDRDRDFGALRDRDRDMGGPRDRDLGGPRDRDRGSGPRNRDFGPRDRDRDMGPRDRDMGPQDGRERDMGGPRDRDRDVGPRGGAKDMGPRGGPRDRPTPDRRGTPREDGPSNWRSAPRDEHKSDRRPPRDEQSTPSRGGQEGRRSEKKDPEEKEKEKTPRRRPREEPDEEGWHTVARR